MGRTNRFSDLDAIQTRYIKKISTSSGSKPYRTTLEVKQHDTVMQYREEFELAARNQRILGQDTLMEIFMNGQKEEIKAEINIVDFKTLTEIIDKATVIEARNNAWRTAGITPGGRKGAAGNQSTNFGLNRNQGWNRARPMITETITRPNNNRNIGQGSKSKTDNTMPLKVPTGTNNNQQGYKVSGPRRLSTKEWANKQRKRISLKCEDDEVIELKITGEKSLKPPWFNGFFPS